MAREIKLPKGKEYTFKPTGGGQPSKYPWDDWFAPATDKDGNKLHEDGSSRLWLLERDECDAGGNVVHARDYDSATSQMPAKIKAAARKHYKVVRVGRHDADGTKLEDALVIRARDMTPEERQAEDVLRAEEREALQGKQAEKKRLIEAGRKALAVAHTGPDTVAG